MEQVGAATPGTPGALAGAQPGQGRLVFARALRGERLTLALYEDGDAAALLAAVEESRGRLEPWLGRHPALRTVDAARDDIARWRARAALGEGASYALRANADGAYLGDLTVMADEWAARCLALGYWLRTGAEGRGYMLEAARLLLADAFGRLGARRVEIHCDARNRRSAAVAERLGFRHEATLRHARLTPEGTLADFCVFGRLAEDDERESAPARAEDAR